MKFKVWLECGDCGSKELTVSKITDEYETEEAMLFREIYCHDGIGWDVNTFEFRCAKCGSKNIKVMWKGRQENE